MHLIGVCSFSATLSLLKVGDLCTTGSKVAVTFYVYKNIYLFQQAPSFSISAKEQVNSDPFLEYKIHTFELTAEHRQNLQLDPKFVPKPHIRVEGRVSSSFQLPINHRIL
jgi:hypothetical protein